MYAETENSEKSELQMGIEPMTFRTLVGRSTTEPRELILTKYQESPIFFFKSFHFTFFKSDLFFGLNMISSNKKSLIEFGLVLNTLILRV